MFYCSIEHGYEFGCIAIKSQEPNYYFDCNTASFISLFKGTSFLESLYQHPGIARFAVLFFLPRLNLIIIEI